MNTRESFSLGELMEQVKNTVQHAFPQPVWVHAEIASLQRNRSGHCYLDLVELNTAQHAKVRVRATIWSSRYITLRSLFSATTGSELQAGLQVMLHVQPTMHPFYGFSLNVLNINPEYTIGRFLVEREETLARLTEEGVIDINRTLELPRLPRRIAVLSSPTAAGYQDFIQHTQQACELYQWDIKLFPATLQGEKAIESISQALDQIAHQSAEWDVVVMIRGGGAQIDLAYFNTYALASRVAQFPIPVLTGIGHERDSSACDAVAYQAFKTPTAVAEFLVELYNTAARDLDSVVERLESIVNQHLQTLANPIQLLEQGLPPLIQASILQFDAPLKTSIQAIQNLATLSVQEKEHAYQQVILTLQTQAIAQLTSLENDFARSMAVTQALSPQNILRHGYALVYQKNQRIKHASQASQATSLSLLFEDGTLQVSHQPEA